MATRYTGPSPPGGRAISTRPGAHSSGTSRSCSRRCQWFRLVPDQTHKVVTAGYGTFAPNANVGLSNYVTTAATTDGKLAVSYLPAGGAPVVDIAHFAGRVRARWYDPTNGTFRPVTGSPFRNADKVRLRTPGKNADGDSDWVLVLSAP